MMKLLLAALLLTATPALSQPALTATEADKAAFGEAVRSYLMENPEVLIEAMTVLEQRRIADEEINDSAVISQNIDAIFDDGHSWVGGNPDGDVTLVEFVDYRCGVCRQVAPHIEETVKDDGNIRIIYKDLPILGQESDLAARFAVAVKQAEGDKAYKLVHDRFFELRGPVTVESLSAMAEDMGFDAKKLVTAMNSGPVNEVLRANAQLADTLKIAGTPSFIIGDQLLRGMPQSGLPPVIEAARETKTGG